MPLEASQEMESPSNTSQCSSYLTLFDTGDHSLIVDTLSSPGFIVQVSGKRKIGPIAASFAVAHPFYVEVSERSALGSKFLYLHSLLVRSHYIPAMCCDLQISISRLDFWNYGDLILITAQVKGALGPFKKKPTRSMHLFSRSYHGARNISGSLGQALLLLPPLLSSKVASTTS